MTTSIYVILAAGSGNRLFPLSCQNIPKQFLKLENEYSLLQNTVRRMSQFTELVITTKQRYLNIMEQQLLELNLPCKYTIIIVPESYNTAYSICAISLLFKNKKIITIPCDKVFNQNEFVNIMKSADELLDKKPNNILFFGIKPYYAATEFGYLECENDSIVRFIEKPTREKAMEFFKKDNYYWNGGMLGFLPNTLKEVYLTHRQDILKICTEATLNSTISENSIVKLIKLADTNNKVEDISIDYAINEKLSKDQMSLIIFQGKWSDIGSWNNVYNIMEKNDDGINKSASCINHKSHDCLIISKKPVYLNNVSNLVFIETDDNILISNMDNTQDIKYLLNKI